MIHLAFSEQRTKAQLSVAVDKTAIQVTSNSKIIEKEPFYEINISEWHEERDLLTEDEVGRLKEEEVIILADGSIRSRHVGSSISMTEC